MSCNPPTIGTSSAAAAAAAASFRELPVEALGLAFGAAIAGSDGAEPGPGHHPPLDGTIEHNPNLPTKLLPMRHSQPSAMTWDVAVGAHLSAQLTTQHAATPQTSDHPPPASATAAISSSSRSAMDMGSTTSRQQTALRRPLASQASARSSQHSTERVNDLS